LLLFGLFMLFFTNVDRWLSEWGQSSISMSVYLEDGFDPERREAIKEMLAEIQGVQIRGFISKEKALMQLREALGGQSGLLDGLSGNPLPASFELLIRDLGGQENVAEKLKQRLENEVGIQEVQYNQQWQERAEGFLYFLRIGGVVIGGFLCLATLFIITNTIKLTIYSRRNEIEILKIVGATDWFVKTPFLMEGAIQGIIGGVLSVGCIFLLHSLFSLKKIYLFGLPVMNIVFLPWSSVCLIIFMGLMLGFVGGFIAIGRFFNL
jgi:cell division transport system permease protein